MIPLEILDKNRNLNGAGKATDSTIHTLVGRKKIDRYIIYFQHERRQRSIVSKILEEKGRIS